MGKKKKEREIQHREIGYEHPQVEVHEFSDAMSRQKVMQITIPPYGGDPEGVTKAIRDGMPSDLIDRTLNDLAAIKELVEYERFSSCEALYPKHAEHHGPVQHPSRFSDDHFKRQAFNHLKRAEVAVSDHPKWTGERMLNEIAPILIRVGLTLAELNIRDNHYEDVDRGSRVDAHMKGLASEQKGKKGDIAREVLRRMQDQISKGSSIKKAARLTFKDGFGTSEDANRQLYYRNK